MPAVRTLGITKFAIPLTRALLSKVPAGATLPKWAWRAGDFENVPAESTLEKCPRLHYDVSDPMVLKKGARAAVIVSSKALLRIKGPPRCPPRAHSHARTRQNGKCPRPPYSCDVVTNCEVPAVALLEWHFRVSMWPPVAPLERCPRCSHWSAPEEVPTSPLRRLGQNGPEKRRPRGSYS